MPTHIIDVREEQWSGKRDGYLHFQAKETLFAHYYNLLYPSSLYYFLKVLKLSTLIVTQLEGISIWSAAKKATKLKQEESQSFHSETR